MLENAVIISLTTSVVIMLLLLITPILEKRYSAGVLCTIWLVIAVRLLIPVRIEMKSPPLEIPAKNYTLIFKSQENTIGMMEEEKRKEYIEQAPNIVNSADYAPIISINELLSFIWIWGAVLYLGYHLISYFIFKVRIRKLIVEDEEKNVYMCKNLDTPIMVGFLKPMILLPSREYSKEEKDVIIKHERMHFKRGHLWFKLILIGANAMHWFNPIVYFMVKKANHALEMSCDEWVVKNKSMDFKKLYSEVILNTMYKKDR